MAESDDIRKLRARAKALKKECIMAVAQTGDIRGQSAPYQPSTRTSRGVSNLWQSGGGSLTGTAFNIFESERNCQTDEEG
jgi:hypothetical protein